MPLPPPSAAITAVLETVDLARGFAFVVVVTPDERIELASWSLHEHLTACGHEVLHGPAERLPASLATTLEGSTSSRPVVLVSESREADADKRADALARMNLQRDTWGDLPVRLIYTCGPAALEELHRFAPDLMHWRALVQPLTAEDLPVATWRTYLAWCIDEHGERDDDRVLTGGLHALHNPLLLELQQPDRAHTFSQWVRKHFRGVVVRAPTGDPRYPAKGLARQWATHALYGDVTAPAPVLVTPGNASALLSQRVIPGTATRIEEIWGRHVGAPTVVFYIDDDAPARPELALGLTHMGLKTIVITDRKAAWHELDWPTAIVMAVLDPLVRSPSRDVVESLAKLLESMFSPQHLQRWLVAAAAPPGEEQVDELAVRLTEELLRLGRINSHFFDDLLKLRPRRRAEIERVRAAFVGLLMDPDVFRNSFDAG